jgi:hypothetical protein
VTPREQARGPELTDHRRARRPSWRNRILVAIAVIAAFGIGLALGEALHDNPHPGGEQTSFRTLPPLTASNPR